MKKLGVFLIAVIGVFLMSACGGGGGGGSSNGNTTGSADTTAPSVPAGLTTAAANSSSIVCHWNASTDNVGVTGYKVYRNGTQIGTTATVAYTDTGLTSSTTYTYAVAAFDAALNTSAPSAPAAATTLASGGTTTNGVPGKNWTIRLSNQMVLASNCQWLNTPPVWSGTNTMQAGYGIVWSGSKFVAVGDYGSILSSSDGVSWTIHSSGNTTLRNVAWSGNTFVAVGDNGAILTSAGSDTWTTATSGTIRTLYGVTSSSSKLVAVGDAGTILTSPDGTAWTVRNSGVTDPLYAVAWSGSQFVTVGYRAATSLSFASGVILTSPDGVTWTPQTSGTDKALYGISWSGNSFAAVGDSGVILTSANGTVWTSQISTNTLPLNSVIWTGSQFVAAGGSHDSSYLYNSPAVLTSPDGATWTKINTTADYFIRGVAWSGTMLVAVGNGYSATPGPSVTPDVIFSSATGATWTPRIKVDFKLKGITGSSSILVAVGTDAILTSADGNIWSINAVGAGLNAVAWTGNKFVAVGDGGVIKTSTDGIIWTPQTSGTTAKLNGILWTGTQSIVAGSGIILTSTDNTTWTARPFTGSNANCDFYSLAWSGTQFVTVGYYYDAGTGFNYLVILSSPDGITWTSRVPNSKGQMTGVAWGNGKFVAVGGASNPYSADGITWLPSTGGGGVAVTWSGSQFVAVGSKGAIYTSADGITWTEQYGSAAFGNAYSYQCTYGGTSQGGYLTDNISFTGITWFGTKFVAISSAGNYIVTSP